MVMGSPAEFYFCSACGAHAWRGNRVLDLALPCAPARDARGKKTGNTDRVSAFLKGHPSKKSKRAPLRHFPISEVRRMVQGDVESDVSIGRGFSYGAVAPPPKRGRRDSWVTPILTHDRMGFAVEDEADAGVREGGAAGPSSSSGPDPPRVDLTPVPS